MARREDYHRHHQQQLHYASILPSNTNSNTNNYHDPRVVRKPNEQARTKALYVDFEDAFQDETITNDYFGSQFPEQYSQQPANFHLQSVETISEVKNSNFSPYIRYQASRETSHPSTPVNTPYYQPRFHHRSNPPSPSFYHHHQLSSNLNRDLTNLNLLQTNNDHNNEIPAPFTPDALRLKIKHQEITPNLPSQSKLILPQYFLVKYLGRTSCTQLWGAKAVRAPIDDMVYNARQLPSMNEIPTLEVCVNMTGLTLTHRHSSTHNKHHHSRSHSPERHQHGLIPLENISYAMHDVKYSKVASCIVLRQSKTSTNAMETLTECYAFLFQSKDHAHRFALTLSEAFNAQKQPTRISRPNHEEKREGRSPQRHSRHRNGHYHHRTHTDHHLRDSQV